MSTVRIFLNGKEADFAADLFPFRIERRGDNFVEIQSAEAVRIDNPARRLVLRGNNRNHEIFQNAHLPHGQAVEGLGSLDIVATVAGTQVLQGEAILRTIVNSSRRSDYSIGIRGGAESFFALISDLELPDLDLGTAVWDTSTIENSWTEDLDTVEAIWAPVYYGRLDPPAAYTPTHIRPHIPFKRIVEATEQATGYKIESQLFETEYFKRHLYTYGNEEAAVTDDFPFSATNNQTTAHDSFSYTPVQFDGEISDAFAVFNNQPGPAGYSFIAPVSGYYLFSGNTFWETQFASSIPTSSMRLRIGGAAYALPLDSQWTVGPILMQPNETATIENRAVPFNSGATTLTPRFMSFTGSLVEATQEGSTIQYASVLHRRPVRDFFDGLSHMFNLVWRADPALRRIYVDPRFEYEIDGVLYPGMYKLPSNTAPADLRTRVSDRNVSQRVERPFGDYVKIGPAEEESYYYEKASLNGSSSTPFMGGRYDFGSPTNETGEEFLNPYFEGALTKVGTNVSGMAHIMPEQEFGEEEMQPNYASNPKWLYYQGVTLGNPWNWNGAQISSRPVAVQVPVGAASYPNVGSYRDWTDPVTGDLRPGYVRRFYLKWLAHLDPGRSITLPVNWRNHEMARPDFGRLCYFSAGTDSTDQLWILTNIKGFDPTDPDDPETTFFLYRELTLAHLSRLSINQQSPNVTA